MKKELNQNNSTKLNLQKKTIKRLSNTSMLQILGGGGRETLTTAPVGTTASGTK